MTVADWPAWFQAVAAVATAVFAWRLNEVTKRQAAVAERQAKTAEDQSATAARQLDLEEQRDRLERTRLTTLAARYARDLSTRLGTVARELEEGVEIGMPQDFYLSRGRTCRAELETLRDLHETLAHRDGEPTRQTDYALEELARATNDLVEFGPHWEELSADRIGDSRRTLAASAHRHLCYAIVHICRSVEPAIDIPHGIPHQTAR